ncbi:hypothetical protein PCP30_00160 [Pseudomonas aeruginosa]|uniref:hypothetical protein n=1 Tax=Pseudomonas aeruginosa TaxID=287 RepID=UPI002E2F2CD0|nr:hypothetical protein [Pseudomonas aeruginosa]
MAEQIGGIARELWNWPQACAALAQPSPAHPAPVEQAGGDERDFQAKGAQEVPSPVSKEYDRHLIGLLRKGEALPGHQEEAADEIERLRDWNDHLNNTVLPNILNPNFLMLMKGGERLLDLCTKDGKFIGVSLNDMKDVFDWMVTHARIAPDHAALAQPYPKSGDYSDQSWINAGCPPEQPEQEEAERPEVFGLERYRVEKTGQGFWPYCVRAGDGTRELFAGHLKQCKRVAAQLATAFEDGKFVAGALRAENAKLSEALDRWPLIRDSLKLRLADALARVAELESKLAELEKQEPVALANRGIHAFWVKWTEAAAGLYGPGIKLYAHPVAQAQHSVPEGVTIERDVAGTIHIKVGDFDFIQLQYQRPYTDNASTWKLAERIASLLAAAPGKEVGHE